MIHTCTRCGKVERKTIYGPHNFGSWKTVTKSTCIKQGVAKKTCKYCGKTKSKKLPLADHQWGPWTVVTPPAINQEGKEHRLCQVCGKEETRPIPPLTDEPINGPTPIVPAEPTPNPGSGKRCKVEVIHQENGEDLYEVTYCELHEEMKESIDALAKAGGKKANSNKLQDAEHVWQEEINSLYERLLDKLAGEEKTAEEGYHALYEAEVEKILMQRFKAPKKAVSMLDFQEIYVPHLCEQLHLH